jgi:hypothetical protein
MQRPDGEFMDEYDVAKRQPIDKQFPYFAGEASFALSREHRLTGEQESLTAASRALAHLVGPAWHFFGDRYYFGEEHWTCQAMDDLYDRAPDAKALDFCLRWVANSRKMEQHAGEAIFDVDGAVGVGPLLAPRITMVASRAEAGMATLEAAIHARSPSAEIAAIDLQMRRSLALLVRRQLTPGPAHLFADPGAVLGGMPGSEVDLQIRIDYVQHAGSALMRYLELAEELRSRGTL